MKIIGICMVIIVIGIVLYFVFMNMSSDRDDNVSLDDIEQETEYQPVVLYFWGDGCPACDEQKPIIDDLEKAFKDLEITFYWLKYSNHKELTEHYDITGVPTTIILDFTGSVDIFVGLTQLEEIEDAIDQATLSYL